MYGKLLNMRLFCTSALVATAVLSAAPDLEVVAHAAPLTGSIAASLAKGGHEHLLAMIPSDTKDPEARLIRIHALVALKRDREVINASLGLATQLPHLSDYIAFIRGEAFSRLGRSEEAMRAYLTAETLPHSTWVDKARLRRTGILLKEKQYKKSRLALRSTLKSFKSLLDYPHVPVLRYRLSKTLAALKQAREAWSEERILLTKWPLEESALRLDETGSKADALGLAELPDAKLKHLTPKERIERARTLRRAKAFKAAIGLLKPITTDKVFGRKALHSLAYTLARAGQFSESVTAYKLLLLRLKGKKLRLVRKQLAQVLTQSGRLPDAIALYQTPPKGLTPKTARRRRAEASERSWLLAQAGHYEEAYQALKQSIGRQSKRRRRRVQPPLNRYQQRAIAWLAYRAGHLEEALTYFGKLPKYLEPFAQYWQARVLAKLNRPAESIKVYESLVERHLRTYYGYLARNRLAELGRIKAATAQCDPENATPKSKGYVEVASMLTAIAARYQHLLPGLARAATLWRIGLPEQARRELRLATLDYAGAVFRGRSRRFRIRKPARRLWEGRPVPGRSQRTARTRAIRAEDPELRLSLAAALDATEVSDFALALAPRTDAPKHHFPRPYASAVRQAAQRFGVDPQILWAIMRTESAYRTDAISRVQATGLMQIMPQTGRKLAKEIGLSSYGPLSLFSPDTNLLLAAHYIAAISTKFHKQLPLIAASYNGGPHNIARWLDLRGKGSATDEFVEEIPFAESRRYAKKVTRLVGEYRRLYCDQDHLRLPNALVVSYSSQPDY